jgi:hypothetical protein
MRSSGVGSYIHANREFEIIAKTDLFGNCPKYPRMFIEIRVQVPPQLLDLAFQVNDAVQGVRELTLESFDIGRCHKYIL